MKRVINPFLILLVFALILAGCNNDDCDFTPPPATLTVTVTAYSLEDGSVLHTGQETITAETDDGSLPAQEKTYASPEVEDFLAADEQTVQLPAVSPGQQMHFSVSFFLPSLLRFVEKSESTLVSSTPVSTETDEVIKFTFIPGVAEEIELPIKAGSRITNMEEVLEYIDGLFPETKGIFVDGVELSTGQKKATMVTTTKNSNTIYDERANGAIEETIQFGEQFFPRLVVTVDEDDFKSPPHLKGYKEPHAPGSQPELEEVNKPEGEELNPNISLAVEIDRKYITTNRTYDNTVVIQGKSYTVKGIQVKTMHTEITITYLNAGSSGQIGDWKPVTGEGVAD